MDATAKPKEWNPKVDRDATTVVALPTLGESVLIMNVGAVAGEDTISVYVLGPSLSRSQAGEHAPRNPGIHCGHAGRTRPERCTSANGGEDGRTGEEEQRYETPTPERAAKAEDIAGSEHPGMSRTLGLEGVIKSLAEGGREEKGTFTSALCTLA